MMHAWIAFACLMTVPVDAVTTDNVETVELNTLYDDAGCETFRQWIFRDDEIRDWRLIRAPWTVERDSLLFVDGERLRRVRFKVWRPSWTQYDPELFERERWPQEERRKLSAGREKH